MQDGHFCTWARGRTRNLDRVPTAASARSLTPLQAYRRSSSRSPQPRATSSNPASVTWTHLRTPHNRLAWPWEVWMLASWGVHHGMRNTWAHRHLAAPLHRQRADLGRSNDGSSWHIRPKRKCSRWSPPPQALRLKLTRKVAQLYLHLYLHHD